MQRKNSFLKRSKNSYRNGIAMIMAISVIVILATIMALSLSLTTQTSKRTTDLYLYEQAVLLSQSASEYAMLQLSQAATPCSLSPITFTYNTIYTVDIDMRYVASTTGSNCSANIPAGKAYTTVSDQESDGTVLMDITVTTNAGTEPIRYFRRSIQKL
ncbi:MAG: hypothetical protein GQ474_02080 [Sulfurimonas sp.]|nr:hypothetical protein [Sulfurimonas sp.]